MEAREGTFAYYGAKETPTPSNVLTEDVCASEDGTEDAVAGAGAMRRWQHRLV